MYSLSPKIPTRGLVFYVDAASKLSTDFTDGNSYNDNYNFFDITGNYPRDYDIPNCVNSPTFSTDFGGYWAYDGATEYSRYGARINTNQFLRSEDNNRRYSIIAWVRIHDNHNGIILSADDPTNSYRCFQFKKKNNGSFQHSHFFYQTADATSNSFQTNSAISNNVWLQIAVTMDGYAASDAWNAGGYIYINGQLHTDVNNVNINKRSTNTTANPKLTIGMQEEGDNTNPFDGDISNIKLYERVLSADEIKQDYNAIGPRFGFDSI
jgi:hypothetical protein|tara:strand:+ start:479 stop:1276 length:798 start_codon:yes stop_codon:yes gene_type:complete